VHFIPGDPVELILGDFYSDEVYQEMTERLGLDKPLHVQYWNYMKGLLTGNFGKSFRSNRDVIEVLMAQFPYTVHLALTALIISAVLGIPTGVVAAVHRNRWPDHLGMLSAGLAVSLPGFALGIILLLIFSLRLGWFPAIGVGDPGDPVDIIMHLVLPAATLGARSAALIARTTRSSVLEVLEEDYVRTARAKGLAEQIVLFRHALRNALIPVVTLMGIDLGRLLSGTTITEIVFSRAGIGHLLVEAVLSRDYPQVQISLTFYVAMIVLGSLVADVLYSLVDPRIRYD
jgi:glutathione transport system permease protein